LLSPANVAVSPDGSAAAIASGNALSHDLWMLDLARKTTTRFTTDLADDAFPVWSPDGQQIVFSSNRDAGKYKLFIKNASGVKPEELLIAGDKDEQPEDWSKDGRYLLYQVGRRTQREGPDNPSLWALPTFGDRKPFEVAGGTSMNGRLSPDGHWLAYT